MLAAFVVLSTQASLEFASMIGVEPTFRPAPLLLAIHGAIPGADSGRDRLARKPGRRDVLALIDVNDLSLKKMKPSRPMQ